ncbi:MAG: hypothetical protein OEQ39_04225 [Gammaproteobacteria bacterium]|nr:hypothetical protein [Gammaproteobacteria bacterium]
MTWWLDPQLTLISDCEATTGWTGGTIVTNDSFQLEGVNCLGEKVSQAVGAENVFTFAANIDMTNQFFIIPMSITGAAATLANGGYRIIIDDGNGDRWKWYVGGSDTTNERWTFFMLDPETIPQYLNGAANTVKAVTSITGTGTTKTCTATGHGMASGDWVKIGGCAVSAFNGDFQIVVTGADTFTYTSTASASPSGGTPILYQICKYTDVDKVGVQMNVTTKSLGNNPNAFWDICWYGRGHQISSIRDPGASFTRSGTTVSFSSTTKLDENVDSSNITFTAPDTISDSNNGFGIFDEGDLIYITGTTGGTNNGTYRVVTVSAGTITTEEQTITTQGTSSGTTVMQRSHGMSAGDRMRVSGAATGYNGDYAVTNVDANKTTFDYIVPSTPASASTTGVMHQIVTWSMIAQEDQANFYGLTATNNEVHYVQGYFVLGSVLGVNFSAARDLLMVDQGFLVVFRENLFLNIGKNALYLMRASTSYFTYIEWDDFYIGANNTTYALATSSGTVNSLGIGLNASLLNGGVLKRFTICNMGPSGAVWDRITFDNIYYIYPEGQTLTNWQMKNSVNPNALGFLLTAEDSADNITDGAFTNCQVGFYNLVGSFIDLDLDNVTFTDVDFDFYIGGTATQGSVSSINRSGSVATVVTTGAHGLANGQYVTISGAVQTEYNGVFKITFISTTSFSYTVSGTPVTPATGTILWEETYVVNNLNGSNASSFGSTGGVGEVDFRTSVTHTVTNLRTGDRVIWIRVSDGVELENLVESSGAATYTYNYVSDTDVDVQVLSGDYARKNTLTRVTLVSTSSGFPAVQAVDNVYLNP